MGFRICRTGNARHRGASARFLSGNGRASRLIAALLLVLLPLEAGADTVRIATFNTDLSRDGPGLLLRDILRGDDAQVMAVARVIAAVAPDAILLQNVDFDAELRALTALRDLIAAEGLYYPTLFARLPNSGMATGQDMDGDGRLGEPEDAQGHGEFTGQGGMAILSRWPVDAAGVQDLSAILWRDIPQPLLPTRDAEPFPNAEALDALRLASVAHWAVPLRTPSGPITLLAFHASPPVFDGPEDRNGRRNHDQMLFWRHYMDGAFGDAPEGRFVLLGHANQDPNRGEGIKAGIRAMLADPRVQDTHPRRSTLPPGAPVDATVDWPKVTPPQMRVGYALPSAEWRVAASGVNWPVDGAAGEHAATASRHRVVWVDLVVD